MKVERLTGLLEKRYGIPPKRKGQYPLDVLILTILSQNTNDQNRDQAFQRLKNQFPRWEDVLNAKAQALVRAIRPGGLANQKAKRIPEILRWIKEHYGKLTLGPLKEMDSEEIKKTIGGLKGVGPKTLCCLLLFGLGREAFPVDTHILRVGKRIGFIPKEMVAEEAHRWMEPLVAKGKCLSLHLNLIRFGREVCRAKTPQCTTCFVARRCNSVAEKSNQNKTEYSNP